MTSDLVSSLKMHITYTSAGFSDATADDMLQCRNEIQEMMQLLMGISSPLMAQARSSGSKSKRRIYGTITRSPLDTFYDPDPNFRQWCELGTMICHLKGFNNVFQTNPRANLGPLYRSGSSVIDIINHAREYPAAYQNKNKGSGAYYGFTR